MSIYVAMVADRHTDPEPHLFSNPVTAVQFARAEAVRLARGNEALIEEDDVDGWLYSAVIGEEGDSVWVIGKDVDESPDRPLVKELTK
jgi:hypothetical protein